MYSIPNTRHILVELAPKRDHDFGFRGTFRQSPTPIKARTAAGWRIYIYVPIAILGVQQKFMCQFI